MVRGDAPNSRSTLPTFAGVFERLFSKDTRRVLMNVQSALEEHLQVTLGSDIRLVMVRLDAGMRSGS